MALVAVALLSAQGFWGPPHPPLVLPLAEAARHGDDVAVSEVAQGLGREGGAGAPRAVHDHGRALVRQLGVSLELEEAARYVHRPRQRSLLVLVRLPHVERDGARLVDQLLGPGRVHLADGRLGLGQQVTGCRHGGSRPSERVPEGKPYLPGRHSRSGCWRARLPSAAWSSSRSSALDGWCATSIPAPFPPRCSTASWPTPCGRPRPASPRAGPSSSYRARRRRRPSGSSPPHRSGGPGGPGGRAFRPLPS